MAPPVSAAVPQQAASGLSPKTGDAVPEFQFKDIYGTIAQENYMTPDDVDEIVG